MVGPILTKFGTIKHFQTSDRPEKFKILKSKVAAAVFEKSKNHDTSVTVGAISTKFVMMQFDIFDRYYR